MTLFKNRTDIQTITEAARIAGGVCDELMAIAQPGVSLPELEAKANQLLALKRSGAPFKQFQGFNHAICVSLNDEIVNGPPSREIMIKENNLVSIAIGSCYKGIHGKAARTKYIGTPPEDVARLLEGTQAVFAALIEKSKTTKNLRELVSVMPEITKKHKLIILEDLGGAGIGKQLHELPLVPNIPDAVKGDIEIPIGMALVFMPMFSLGTDIHTVTLPDGWTIASKDKSLSAHFAETMLMTDSGFLRLSSA